MIVALYRIIKALTFLMFTVTLLSFQNAIGQLNTQEQVAEIDNLLREISEEHKPKTYQIQNVSVLTMADSAMLENQDVLVKDGIIRKIGKGLAVDSDATIIDGTGMYLMPGLTDMHVHLTSQDQWQNNWLLLLLINGVTTVRDMHGDHEKLILRENIRSNKILGPNLYQTGKIINDLNNHEYEYAPTPERGREIVIEQKTAGHDFVKVYNELKKDVYNAVLNEAEHQEILVIGHVPDGIEVLEAVNHLHTIEHLTGYKEWNDSEVYLNAPENYAEITATSNTWNCPTLLTHLVNWDRQRITELINDDEISKLVPDDLKKKRKKHLNKKAKQKTKTVQKHGPQNVHRIQEIVLKLHRANAKLIAGTDATPGFGIMIPGFSLHEELKSMVEIGIPIYDVLEMTTCNAALAMGKEEEFGTIEEGKRADLLLLNSNPFDDIDNLKDKSGVMVRGIWLSDEVIEEISTRIQTTFGN